MHVNLNSTTSEKVNSTKSENSLHELTKRFLKLLEETSEKVIDLNTAAYLLNVAKRRVYDITNVLEGLGLLQKIHVNHVKWIGGDIKTYFLYDRATSDTDYTYSESSGFSDILSDCIHSKKTENPLEAEIKLADRTLQLLYEEIALLSNSEKNVSNAYVTYEDLQALEFLKNKIIFVVKTSENVKIEFPRNGSIKNNEVSITSNDGNIEVFHVSNRD